jgi:hypothetical protein
MFPGEKAGEIKYKNMLPGTENSMGEQIPFEGRFDEFILGEFRDQSRRRTVTRPFNLSPTSG